MFDRNQNTNFVWSCWSHTFAHCWAGMSNGSTFVSPHCWTNNVRQFDISHNLEIVVKQINLGWGQIDEHCWSSMTSQLIIQCCWGWPNCPTCGVQQCVRTMLKGYVKLTYIYWTTNQTCIVIIFSQFFIRKDSSVVSALASWTRGPRFDAGHLTEFFFLLVCDDILLACDFYICFHSLSLFFFELR